MMGRRSAFTLLELLLAMSAGMAVLLAATALLGDVSEKCGRLRGGVAARREFRFALTEWSADLRAAVPEMEWWSRPNDTGAGGDRVGFFLLQAPSKQSVAARAGDLCVVNYYLKDLESSGRCVRCLMRGLRESAEVYPALNSGDVDKLFEPRDSDEPVAFGVVRFEARRPSPGKGAVEWRVELARRELERRTDTPGAWDALTSQRRPSEEKQIEIRTGATAFGHEDVH